LSHSITIETDPAPGETCSGLSVRPRIEVIALPALPLPALSLVRHR
jgi:hypothetical protein